MKWFPALLVLLLATPIIAQADEIENRIAQVIFTTAAALFERRAVSGVVGDAAAYWQARGEMTGSTPKYTALKSNKAIAACIAWGSASQSELPIRAAGLAWRRVHMSDAVQSALWYCQKNKADQGATGCECDMVAENDKIVVAVPSDFLARMAGKLPVKTKTTAAPTATAPPLPNKQIAATPMDDSPAPIRKSAYNVPMAISWDGVWELLSGKLSYTEEGTLGQVRDGKIKARLPSGEAECNGVWRLSSGKYGTSTPPTGTWSIACTNGLAASGEYTSHEPGRGSGIGEDTQGRRVKISFGS